MLIIFHVHFVPLSSFVLIVRLSMQVLDKCFIYPSQKYSIEVQQRANWTGESNWKVFCLSSKKLLRV